MNKRLHREKKTIKAMIRTNCRDNHHPGGELCGECAELMTYAEKRLLRCPFSVDKPTCPQCPVHCYKPEKREQVRQVMRYAGPRMLLRHPVLTFWHVVDGWRRGGVLVSCCSTFSKTEFWAQLRCESGDSQRGEKVY